METVNEPLVSVVIPTRNRIKLLKRALQTVYDQTYKKTEIIVVDDGSDDGTLDFLKAESCDKGIYFISNKQPGGASRARNLGIMRAKGEIVTFLDDDDEWLPEKLIKQIQPFKDPEIGMVYTGAELIKVDHHLTYHSIPKLDGNIFNELLIENRIGTTSIAAIRTQIAKELLFDEAIKARHDYELWIRISKKYKISGIKEPLVKVYARNMLTRVTSNISDYEGDVQRINEKFKEDIQALPVHKQKERRAAQYFFLGAQALEANNLPLCRKYFFKSMIKHPRTKYLGGFMASLFGVKALFKLRKLKKII